MPSLGRTTWVIADGFIPESSTGPEPEMLSHETASILNAGDGPAQVRVTVYFSDQEPVGPYELTVEARRTSHVRFNDLEEPQPVPLGTDYAAVIESDVPVVVWHTRLDTRQAANSLALTAAWPAD